MLEQAPVHSNIQIQYQMNIKALTVIPVIYLCNICAFDVFDVLIFFALSLILLVKYLPLMFVYLERILGN